MLDSELFQILIVLRRIVIESLHLGRSIAMVFSLSQIAGLSSGRRKLLYYVFLGLDVVEVIPGLVTSSGCSRISSIVMACTFAPATTPLCAIGVAIEIPLAQLWPGPPGIFDGYAA